MTLTLDIAPAIEEILRRRAGQTGREEQKLAAEMLTRTLIQEDAEWNDAVAAIEEGIADGEAGREEPFENFVAASRAARSQRRAGMSV